MLKKKLMALGIAAVFTLSSLTTTVLAADFAKSNTDKNMIIKVAVPGKGNGHAKDKKNIEKNFKFIDSKDVSWALNAIEKLAGKGILGGVGQGKFAPKSNVTHIEALAMVMRLTGDDKEADSMGKKIHPSYKGVMPLWGYGYIYVAIEKGILLPEELKDFNPNKPAKRHEIAKYIIRAMGKTDEALEHMDEKLSFNDSSAVPKNSVGYVYLVNELEIMIGSNNKFKPMEPVTRAEMAVLLDRAEGDFTLPDSDKRINKTVFVSADVDDNEITVKVKGSKVTYDVLKGVQVYKNDSFETIEDLVAGDVLQLIFNDKKEVIFIEVIKEAEDDDEVETEISFSKVSYNNLPEVLQDEVDELKSTKNYKAYEYNNYIYLLAAMGKKSTGGYNIVFEEVYKVENDDDFTVKAVIDTDEPSSKDFVTQAVTYPYSVVKFKSFDDIDSVKFVDEDGDKLAEVKIKNVDEDDDEEIQISYEAVDYNDLAGKLKDQVDYLKLTRNYKAYEYDNYVYLIAAMGKKTTSGYEIDIDDVYKVENGSKYTINAVVEAEIPSSGKSRTAYYPYSIVRFKYFDNIDVVKFIDEDNDKLAEVKIVELDEVVTVEGIISSINTSSKTIKVKKSNGSVVTLTIPNDAEITVNDDENERISDLEVGMKVKVKKVDERVTEVIAEDNLEEVEGILTGISISSVKKITLKIGSTSKTYTVDSDVKIIIDDETARVEDLKIDSELTLRFSNGLLVEIEK